MKVFDVLKYFLKNEYLTSTCTWYIFGVLGVLKYSSTWSTVLDPNPVSNTKLCRQRSVRWITSLAGGNSRWEVDELVGRGPRHTAPPSPQTT